MLLLFLGTEVIWTITLLQVTALTIAASRQSTRASPEMDREDQENDLFQFRPPRRTPVDCFPALRRSRDEADPSTASRRPVDRTLNPSSAAAVTGRSSRSVLGRGKWTFSSRTHSSSIVAP